MSTTGNIDLGEFNIASVDRIKVSLKKDGVYWTGLDSVTFVFEKPDRATQFTRTATLETDATGTWYYDTTVTDFLVTGNWTMGVYVVDSGVTKRYPYEIGFHVSDQP